MTRAQQLLNLIAIKIAENFREYVKERGDHNPLLASYRSPLTGQMVTNGVTVEVPLLQQLDAAVVGLSATESPKPYGYHFEWAHCVTCDGPKDWRWVFSLEGPGETDDHYYYHGDRIRNFTPLFEGSK